MADGGQNPDWSWDELVLACDLLASNGWKPLEVNHPKVVELAEFMKSVPLNPAGLVERTVDSIRRKMANLESHHPTFVKKPTNSSKLGRIVVERFVAAPSDMRQEAEVLRVQGAAGEFEDLPPLDVEYLDDVAAVEGRVFVRRHIARERNRRLKNKKIEQVLAGGGRIACQVCDFDFGKTYGSRGAGYIECHHVVPLYVSGTTKTSLRQLALICANCHRMIHRSDPWLTPDDLKTLIVR